MECHDQASYRSFNGLTCAHHQGTDCTAWLYVLEGNITALGELINQCPVSCNIPCGSFTEQLITLSFIVADIPNLLDVQTETPLLEVSEDYLASFVEANSDSTFVLETVELKAQEPLERRLGGLRKLQTQPLQLRVALSLIGFTIGFDPDELTKLLIKGVDSAGFTAELQASSEFFARAQASSAVREFPKAVGPPPKEESEPDSLSTATILVSVIAGLVAVAFSVGLFILWDRTRARKQMETESETSSEICPDTPQGGSLFSFSQPSTPRGQKFYPSDGGNMLGSLSRSSDEESIEGERRESPSALVSEAQHDDHPLSLLIPPMLVFDNIDEKASPHSATTNPGNHVVPSRCASAPSSLLQALSTSRNPKTPPFSDLLR